MCRNPFPDSPLLLTFPAKFIIVLIWEERFPLMIPYTQETAMGVLTGSGYCPYCREKVMVACTANTHALHLLLTLLTGGIWGIVWLYFRFQPRACVCCQCGRGLTRTRLQTSSGSIPDTPWPSEADAHNHLEFNSFLVTRNLVYYIPTSARYRGI